MPLPDITFPLSKEELVKQVREILNPAYERRSIDEDIRQGVTREEVIEFLDKVLNDHSFSNIIKKEGSKKRIAEMQVI